MIIKKMHYIISNLFVIIFLLFNSTCLLANQITFDEWLSGFKQNAIKSGISKEVVIDVMSDAKFLPRVIEYDRFQPEFYEDTFTYIKKRTNKSKVSKGTTLYKKEKLIIDKIENEFLVEKELLLSLMGIETNFGKYLGKMDIVSSLATLSYDQRRSKFFTDELMILLRLVDKDIIKKEILFGSWAGAFGNFQFMPRTIKNYAVDYNENNIVELKKIEDSFASAANYLKKIGWKKNQPCFIEIKLKDNVPKKYLNSSARKLHSKRSINYFKKYIENYEKIDIDSSYKVSIITPDKDIIPGSDTFTPAFIVFENYEKILKWNRSLRFALAVCVLKERFENEI